jgi:hypothetical protein
LLLLSVRGDDLDSLCLPSVLTQSTQIGLYRTSQLPVWIFQFPSKLADYDRVLSEMLITNHLENPNLVFLLNASNFHKTEAEVHHSQFMRTEISCCMYHTHAHAHTHTQTPTQ